MFEEQTQNPCRPPLVKNYHQMLWLIDETITKAPEFNETIALGLPIYVVLQSLITTVGGFAAFLNEKVNYHIKNILNERGKYLKSKESCYVQTLIQDGLIRNP